MENDNHFFSEEEKKKIEKNTEDVIEIMKQPKMPTIVQNGEGSSVVNINNSGDGDINHSSFEKQCSELRIEIKYLKQLLEEKEEHLNNIIDTHKAVIHAKNEEIKSLNETIDYLKGDENK